MENSKVSDKNKKSKEKSKKNQTKNTDIIKKNYGPAIIKLYIADPEKTYTAIAKEVGCNESTVRQYVGKKGKYRELVENAIAEHFGKEIFILQTKAFKRMNELLDDPMTPHAVQASISKYLMDRFEIDRAVEKGEITEWETEISESGILKQTKRMIHVSKKNHGDTESKGSNIIRGEDSSEIIDI